jgi:predicted O-linked N-acetylglucosamine transferase (SPINDLY family)
MKSSVRATRRNARSAAPAGIPGAVATRQSGDLAFGEAHWRATLLRNPSDPLAPRALSDIAHQSGRYGEAAKRLGPIAEGPADFSNLGISLAELGQDDAAETAYRRAIALDPKCAAAHFNLGNLLHKQQRNAEAEKAFRAALSIRTDYSKAWNGLGQSLQCQGRLNESLSAFRTAVRYDPACTAAHCNIGTILFALDHNAEALIAFRRALTLDPGHALAHGNIGALLARSGWPIAAESASRTAISLAPDQHCWLTNLGVALLAQGRYAEAEACYRKALAMRPDYAVGHGNLLFALNYRTDVTEEAVFAECDAWDRRHARHLAPTTPNYTLDRTPGRRLRVGYVSADFRQHAVAMFAEPLIAAHERSTVELYLYSGVAAEDAETDRFRSLSDHWHNTIGLTDAELSEHIYSDKIDVLVDLAGHSAGNRLLTFARRPAPVQVAYLLGHGYSTGMSAMDAFLADSHLAPAGADALFSERLIRLPRIPLAYAPPDGMPLVTALPALSNGYVTFGHFGRTERLNDMVIATWSHILHAVPSSRLVLDNKPFQEPAFRERFLAHFARHGIEPARLDLVFSAPQPRVWAAYGGIDIALDPFPHNAGTTTIEALWQGVPVISLAGRPTVGRFGSSILHAVGLDDWVADTIDGYVKRALAAASDLPSLAQMRQDLRRRVAVSPLCDATGLARAIEATYRMLWDEWREGDVPRLHRLYTQGHHNEATELASRMLRRDEAAADAHHVLGLLAYHGNRQIEADSHLRAAIECAPAQAELHANHAAILRKAGRLADAESAARSALTLEPERVSAHNNLGNILRDAGRYDESAGCYRAAVRLSPDFVDAWVNLAWVLALAGHARQAEEAARQAIACDTSNPDAHNNLGLALMRQGRLAEAEAALRQALALRPERALPHSNILFCLNYRVDVSAEEIFAEYRRWDIQHAQPLMPARRDFNLDRSPDRRLRVGYVSPDFRQHAVALFAEPLLAAHDRSMVEVHCYAEVPAPDAVTERFRTLSDHWHSTVGLSDEALAAQIRRDRIDILVDLAGHTAGNRLLTFARKPAPVQVEWLLGHGYSSGLSAMDAFLADPVLAPQGAEPLFSEGLVRLSRIPLVYAPPTEMPDVAFLPAVANGYITFGYFGRTVRLNDAVLAVWARILHAVPGSRLMLNSAPFGEPASREQMTARFAALGIDSARLELVHTSPQPRTWAAYGGVDIALDPFPHNAGTTTIEALWQGVPVLSLAGRPTVGRFGAAILHAIGLDDWVTNDIGAYVARAVAASADIAALTRLRGGLRARFAASPLRDAAGLAREIEAVYRTLWRRWCETESLEVRQIYAAGDADGAARLAEQLLQRDPNNAAALHVLGLIKFNQGDATTAAELLRRSLETATDAAVLSDLGVMLRTLGRLTEAEEAYSRALALDPCLGAALGNPGNVLLDQHRADEAEPVLREALRQAPDQPWLLRSLALCQMSRGAADQAEAALRRAVAIDTEDAEAHDTLGALLGQSGRPIEAEAHYRIALAQTRQPHRVLSNLAIALQAQGRHAEAEQCCRGALLAQPNYHVAHSNLLFSLNYRNDLTGGAIFAEYVDWDRRHAAALAPQEPRLGLDRSIARRLRVGYVSADFRQHAVAWFAEPLLAAHDRSCIEVFCYAAVTAPDTVTARFRALAEHWRSIVGLDDAAVADLILRDGVDVLVDLSGHTAGSRLLVFARKPAPVQIEYLLGHGYTSGLSAMNAFLADAVLAPPGADALFSERVMRLPRIPLAYAPPDTMPPVAPLPALANGFVTFGYFGRTERLNDAVIAAWARILHDVPAARLVLNSLPYREPAFRELIAARFAGQGIDRDRLDLIATVPQPVTCQRYGAIDIALDPFPHNAGTTTIEALWQGVPVVSLAGRPSVGRFGAMILHAVGMDNWVSEDADGYVARAVAAAADTLKLARIRAVLRQRVADSPLCDAAGLARHVEAAYRALWAAC